MNIQQRIVEFVIRSNWILLISISIVGLILTSGDFACGLICGGLITTVNFHLLARTLRKAFTPASLVSHNVILAKYYFRFIVSGVLIFVLISRHWVDPLGLILGLSVVVASIMLATIREFGKHISKEAF